MTLAPATPLADVLEKEWQAQVVQLLRTLGWKRIYHTHDSRRSAYGFPDLVCVRDRLVMIELKRERGKLTTEQAGWFRDLLAAGVEAYVARPRNLNALAKILAHPGDPWDVRAPGASRDELRNELRKEIA